MFRSNHFTTRERLYISRCLAVMEELAKEDDFFAEALDEFNHADGETLRQMCKYLLEIYSDWKENRCFSTLELAIQLSAYPA